MEEYVCRKYIIETYNTTYNQIWRYVKRRKLTPLCNGKIFSKAEVENAFKDKIKRGRPRKEK